MLVHYQILYSQLLFHWGRKNHLRQLENRIMLRVEIRYADTQLQKTKQLQVPVLAFAPGGGFGPSHLGISRGQWKTKICIPLVITWSRSSLMFYSFCACLFDLIIISLKIAFTNFGLGLGSLPLCYLGVWAGLEWSCLVFNFFHGSSYWLHLHSCVIRNTGEELREILCEWTILGIEIYPFLVWWSVGLILPIAFSGVFYT